LLGLNYEIMSLGVPTLKSLLRIYKSVSRGIKYMLYSGCYNGEASRATTSAIVIKVM